MKFILISAGTFLLAACTTAAVSTPETVTSPSADQISAMFTVTDEKSAVLFSRSGILGEDARPLPLFRICALPESGPATNIWLHPSQGRVADGHPTVKTLALEPGSCVFAGGGYIEARLSDGPQVQAVSWPGEPRAYLRVTPIGLADRAGQ